MKKLAFLLVLSLGFISLSAEEPVKGEPEAIKSSQIQGTIIDSSTGEALTGVALKVKGTEKKTFSDLEGRFSIENVVPGTYEIEVSYVSYKGIILRSVTASSKDVKLKVELESVSN